MTSPFEDFETRFGIGMNVEGTLRTLFEGLREGNAARWAVEMRKALGEERKNALLFLAVVWTTIGDVVKTQAENRGALQEAVLHETYGLMRSVADPGKLAKLFGASRIGRMEQAAELGEKVGERALQRMDEQNEKEIERLERLADPFLKMLIESEESFRAVIRVIESRFPEEYQALKEAAMIGGVR
ncbi:MAG: hypothetical protein AB1486_18695 [Planctomycetota bacterium]